MTVYDDAAGYHREAEKTDAADVSALLNEPTMWLGAQDGRYLVLHTLQLVLFLMHCADMIWHLK